MHARQAIRKTYVSRARNKRNDRLGRYEGAGIEVVVGFLLPRLFYIPHEIYLFFCYYCRYKFQWSSLPADWPVRLKFHIILMALPCLDNYHTDSTVRLSNT